MISLSISDILHHLDETETPYAYQGCKDLHLTGFSSLTQYRTGTFTWAKKQENWDTRPGAEVPTLLFAQYGVQADCPNQIVTEQFKHAFFETIEHFFGGKKERPSVGAGTYIGADVVLGDRVQIGANCTLDGEITVGDDTIIANNVVISNRVVIGKRCEIQSLSVIGEDGFGYSEEETGRKTMVKHFGGVVVGDDVFIGSHVNIARAVIDNTVIGDGVKIAPSTHIGHNGIIGKNATIICSRIYGSVKLGENAYVTSCTIKNQTTVGNGALVGMGAVVVNEVPDGETVVGIPAKPIKHH